MSFEMKPKYAVALSAALLCLAAALVFPVLFAPGAGGAPGLDITFLDVGQADSAVVFTPRGAVVLVDAGEEARFGNHPDGGLDSGGGRNARRICALLRDRGARGIDVLAVSHTDVDHVGAAAEVLREFPARTIVSSVPGRGEFLGMVPGLRTDARYIFAGAGDAVDVDGEIVLECLYPDKHGLDTSLPANSRSLVFALRYGAFGAMFTGDADETALRGMLPLLGGRAADGISVLKMPHHGGDCPLLGAFVRGLGPKVAVISCGRGNPYGHPAQGALALLGSSGVAWARTDRNGSVAVHSDGRSFSVSVQRQALRFPDSADAGDSFGHAIGA